MITLTCVMDDAFDVYQDKQRIGEIALMSDGWAAYAVNNAGRVQPERIGTYDSAMRALMALKA